MSLTQSQREMWKACYIRGFKQGLRFTFEAHGQADQTPTVRPSVPDGLADLCADPRQMFNEGWQDGRHRGHLKLVSKAGVQA